MVDSVTFASLYPGTIADNEKHGDQPMALGERNNVRVDHFLPWVREYAFLDTPDYLADKVPIAREVPVRFRRREFGCDGSPYVVVFCRFSRRYEGAFFKCMADLERKLLMSGHHDYPEWCERLFGRLVNE